MKTQYLPRFHDWLKKDHIKNSEAVAYCKTAKAVTSTFSAASLTLIIQDLHKGQYSHAAILLPFSLCAYEFGTILDNVREVFEKPIKGVQALHATCSSDQKLWRFITKGAPFTRAIGLLYLNLIAEQNQAHQRSSDSYFSRIWHKQ